MAFFSLFFIRLQNLRREELQAKALEEEKAKIAASSPKGKASAPAAAS